MGWVGYRPAFPIYGYFGLNRRLYEIKTGSIPTDIYNRLLWKPKKLYICATERISKVFMRGQL